jgi:hypothetical protein
MLVYGDWSELVDPAERLKRLRQQVRAIGAMSGGLDRHALLVRALIEAGQLLQGLADCHWPAFQMSDLVHRLALCVVRSFDSEFELTGDLPAVTTFGVPRCVELRLPEGFAFYALYPEAYIKAARQLRLESRPRVIGIRSIGTTLAAVVAAAIDAPPAVTVRPVGDAFARKVDLPAEIIEADVHYVIVDEGPGLSGSSFGAVADWLEERGIPLGRIAFLPSHSEDLGPQASDAHRKRWHVAQRIAAKLEPGFLERLFGPLQALPRGGPWQRTKFLVTKNGDQLLVKFAGLGATGEAKLAMARALHAAGFVPEPLGLVHGFLVERWFEDAQPLDPEDKPLSDFGRYIGARARLFAAAPDTGAPIERLLTMCRRNIGLALGPEAASTLARFDVRDLGARVRRVRTDNKLQPEEWLWIGCRLLKADALDHHQAHDLIGCQGIEWDVAALTEEFRLGPREEDRLLQAAGIEICRELLDFYRIAYAAFRLGQSDLAGDAASVDRYSCSLKHLLHQDS